MSATRRALRARPARSGWARAVGGALLLAGPSAPALRAFLGIGDTSFVTVIANPAEAANWAAQLRSLSSQLSAAQAAQAEITTIRLFAGNPSAAAAGAPALSPILQGQSGLASGGQTAAALGAAWDASGGAAQLAAEQALLGAAGQGGQMQVGGQVLARNPALYEGSAEDASVTAETRRQIAAEQALRASVAAALQGAWSDFRGAQTESSKQAVLAEISQLLAIDEVADARRRALMDDLALSDRQVRTQAAAASTASDESSLAESSALVGSLAQRTQAGEAQRIASLQKAAPAEAAPAYDALRLWTPADAGPGGGP